MLHRFAAITVSLVTGAGLLTAPAAARALTEGSTTAPNPRVVAPRAPAPLPATPTTPTTGRRCGPEPTTAQAWERMFDALSGPWSGGDGAASVRLPDGRILWLFGDTFVGTVGPRGERARSTRLVRNSIVLTEGTCATPTDTRTDTLPGTAGSWLWPTQGVLVGTEPGGAARVLVFAQRLSADDSDAFGFRRVGAAVVSVLVPRGGMPIVGAVTPLPPSGVLWGAAVLREGATTWVYGTRSAPGSTELGRDLLLARAPTATLGDQSTWVYRTAAGWSTRESEARVVRPAAQGVSTVTSFARIGGRYVGVTKAHEFLDDTVVALVSATPWGPWRTTPLFSAASTATVLAYQPMLVSSWTRGRDTFVRVVVSRTSTEAAAIMRDAEITRPSFVDVRLPR